MQYNYWLHLLVICIIVSKVCHNKQVNTPEVLIVLFVLFHMYSKRQVEYSYVVDGSLKTFDDEAYANLDKIAKAFIVNDKFQIPSDVKIDNTLTSYGNLTSKGDMKCGHSVDIYPSTSNTKKGTLTTKDLESNGRAKLDNKTGNYSGHLYTDRIRSKNSDLHFQSGQIHAAGVLKYQPNPKNTWSGDITKLNTFKFNDKNVYKGKQSAFMMDRGS